MFARKQQKDAFAFHAKTSDPRIIVGTALWIAGSLIHAAKAAEIVLDWPFPASAQSHLDAIRRELEEGAEDGE